MVSIKSQRTAKEGFKKGTPQNFTAATRKLGRLTYQTKVANDPKRKQLVAIIKRCRAEGLSFGQIAKELNAKGFTTTRGKRFFRATVKSLLMPLKRSA